ncbi:MAG: acyl-ACP--UDP-N-acetylglucosamine O-acyltransferase [Gammaproteobacteria bacterium]
MTAKIHESASVGEGSTIASSAVVGKGAIVESGAVVGEDCDIGAYGIIWAGARLGKDNRIFPFCSLGGEPQDKKYQGEQTQMTVGDGNIFREYCMINCGTKGGGGKTIIGSGNLLMAYSHLAHDCIVGDGAIIANAAQIAGHVVIGDYAVIGGGALVQQFSRIGECAMVGGGEKIRQDIPPFAWCAEGVVAVNRIGLLRRGASEEVIGIIRRAFRLLYRSGLQLADAVKQIQTLAGSDGNAAAGELKTLTGFLSQEKINIIRPARQSRE